MSVSVSSYADVTYVVLAFCSSGFFCKFSPSRHWRTTYCCWSHKALLLCSYYSSFHLGPCFSVYTWSILLTGCNSTVSSTKSQPFPNNKQFLNLTRLLRRQIYWKCFLGLWYLMLWIEWLCQITGQCAYVYACQEYAPMSSSVLYHYIYSVNADGYFK